MFKDNVAILCGLQTDTSYNEAVRVNVPKDETEAPDCPQNTVACSLDRELGGMTVCVEEVDDCPVTDLVIYLKDSPEEAPYRNNADYSISCTPETAG